MSSCNGCFNSPNSILKFKCNHAFCNKCVPLLYISNSSSFKFKNFKENFELTCILCSNGRCDTNMEDLSKVIQDLKIDNNFEHYEHEFCENHNKKFKFFCKTCSTKLCYDCLNDHDDSHKMDFLANLKFNQCPKHNEILKLFCFTHNDYICSVCCTTDHKICKNSSLEQYFNDSKSDFNKLKINFNQIKDKLVDRINIDENITDIEKQRKESQENFNKVITHLENLLAKLNDMKLKYDESFSDIINNYQIYQDNYKKSMSILEYIVNNEQMSNLYLMNSAKNTINHINTLKLEKVHFNYHKFQILPVFNFEQLEKDNLNIQNNFLNFNSLTADFKCIKSIQAHDNCVTAIIELKSGLLASASDDKTLKIWDTNSDFTCIKTLQGHDNCITSIIELRNNLLASASWDNTIKLWDGNKDYACIKTLQGHGGNVFSIVELKNGSIASGSADKTIKLWDANSDFNCVKTLQGHSKSVSSIIELRNGLLASGSWDEKIKLWDGKKDYTCIKTIGGHGDSVWVILELRNGLLVSGSNDKTIKLWDGDSEFSCVRTLLGHKHYVNSLAEFKNGLLASGSLDTTIKIWDGNSEFNCIRTLQDGNSLRSIIELGSKFLASGSFKIIKIWTTENLNEQNNASNEK